MKPHTILRHRLPVVLGALGLTAVLALIILRLLAGSPVRPLAAAPPPGPQTPQREADGGGQAPNISFIDSPSATCTLPVAGTNACYIQWSYLSVSASSSAYIISMTVSIDGRYRAFHSGFFQTSMYIPGSLTAPGYKVACGPPGSGGLPDWGSTHTYTIRARETTGLASANYGSVTCPADEVKIFIPAIQKP
ncbi:MAG: hypothetical protein H6659_00740 [Ardenticatenaceae bacterium]|nr:hypothetical protein [Anaerolineales bacterium]MCB8982331.1 hypothetical protein [Ardenticatenaceae bacterium]